MQVERSPEMSVHAKFVRKFRSDPTLRLRVKSGNHHPETHFSQRPNYETTSSCSTNRLLANRSIYQGL